MKRPAKRIDGVVSDLIQKWQTTKLGKADAVRGAWKKAAPEESQPHAQPVSFKYGVVMVIVENSSWLYRLTMEKRTILERFNENYTGRKKAVDIRFRVGESFSREERI